MLFTVLFLIYLIVVSVLRYEQPQDVDRFIEGIQEVMQTEFSQNTPRIDQNTTPVVEATSVFTQSEAITVDEKSENLYNSPQPLPTSLRGLRAYIIEHQLQSKIRAFIGKSYSHCKLSELKLALSHI